MSLGPGTRLGPYEIVAPAGAGGMGEVYRAKDTRLDRTVAIKVLPSHLSDRPELRQRLDREARAISSLSHPHICALHDVGHQDGVDFLVMEFLEGETLADRLRKSALPAEQLLRAGLEIADALDAAHRRGIVHRDLKPGNVMLTKSGVKLLDFGLAKAIEPPASTSGFSALPTRADDLTGEGTILGTFQYMAPEQLEGKEADARTDLFALGAVLYEMATGRKAFEGKSQASLIAAILEREPAPISTIAPMTPPALDRLVKTCLAKDPDDRWQTAHDVALQLRWIAEGGSVAGVPAPVASRRRGRERVGWALAAVALVAAAALSVAHFRRAPIVVRPVRSHIMPPAGTRFDFDAENSGSLTVSPNGRHVTYTAHKAGGNSPIWIRSLDDLSAHPLVGTEEGKFPFWSPDSRQIAFFANGKLKRIDLVGSPPVDVCDASDGRGGTWGRDDAILFAPDWRSGIHRVPATGGAAAPVTTLDEASKETTHRWPLLLPDGRHFLYTAGEHGTGTKTGANAIFLATLGSNDRTLLLNARSNVAYASGRLLFVRENALLAQPFDLKTLKLAGDPVPLANDVGYASDYFRADFSASENGVLVYEGGAKEDDAELGLYDRSGKKVASVGEPGDYGACMFSPDESRVAVTVGNPSAGSSDVWIYELARGVGTRLTFGLSDESEGVWSPDGKRIVYRQLDRAWSDLYVKDASGFGREEPILQSKADKLPFDWSPDGKLIAYNLIVTGEKAHADIWMLPVAGDREPFPFLETEFHKWFPQFSPDGRWLLYFSDESGRNEVYVTAFPGGGARWQISTGGGDGGQWSRGGSEVVYIAPDGETIMSVEVKAGALTFEVGTPKPLFKLSGVTGGDTSADGERFLAAVKTSAAETPTVTLVTNWNAGIVKRE